MALDIYQRAHRLAVEVHRMTLDVSEHELSIEVSQIRRSSKTVAAQIVEGYCLRKNKNEFVQNLNRAYASAHETAEHLDLHETRSLSQRRFYEEIRGEYDRLCRMIFRHREWVMQGHEPPPFVREYCPEYYTSHITHTTSER